MTNEPPVENKGLVILDGNRLVVDLKKELQHEAAEFKSVFYRPPGLAMIVIGNDRVSIDYVEQAAEVARELDYEFMAYMWPADTGNEELANLIKNLNADTLFDGISIQAPLPPHINYEEVAFAINPVKDVEGYHPVNVGRLFSNLDTMLPPPAVAGIELLLRYGINPAGMHAAVVGRSRIIGKPLSGLLAIADATVTVCHSSTRDLPTHLRTADLIIACAGQPNLITGDMVKPGAVIIDYGKNYEDGELIGDVEWASVSQVAGALSPVIGGVGPLTTLALMANTLKAAHRSQPTS